MACREKKGHRAGGLEVNRTEQAVAGPARIESRQVRPDV